MRCLGPLILSARLLPFFLSPGIPPSLHGKKKLDLVRNLHAEYSQQQILSFYKLTPAISPLFVIVLIATLSTALRLFLNVSSRFPLSCLSLLLGLFIGSTVSFCTYNGSTLRLLSLSDATIALLLYSTSVVLFPFAAILLSEIIIFRFALHHSIVFPSLLFALAGIAQERVGVGRALWWVRKTGEIELRWLGKLKGSKGSF
ncbi:hypothetical protein JCM16303_006064 [Sporobolomyces ruberrimus]